MRRLKKIERCYTVQDANHSPIVELSFEVGRYPFRTLLM